MLLKLGVDISKLHRPIRKILNHIENIYQQHNEEPVITSTYEGTHSPSSLHYCHDAVDVRNPTTNRDEIYKELEQKLGKDYDVVQERRHIHIEYDPKG